MWSIGEQQIVLFDHQFFNRPRQGNGRSVKEVRNYNQLNPFIIENRSKCVQFSHKTTFKKYKKGGFSTFVWIRLTHFFSFLTLWQKMIHLCLFLKEFSHKETVCVTCVINGAIIQMSKKKGVKGHFYWASSLFETQHNITHTKLDTLDKGINVIWDSKNIIKS